MYGAYAIIHTLPFFLITLTMIGVICWGVGQLRAQFLWDRADRECDWDDEENFVVGKIFEARRLNSFSEAGKFDLTDDYLPDGNVSIAFFNTETAERGEIWIEENTTV